jgi:hypothetical protein
MISFSELERVGEESAVAYFKTLYRHIPGGIEVNLGTVKCWA